MFCRSPLYSQDFTPLFFNPEDFTPFFSVLNFSFHHRCSFVCFNGPWWYTYMYIYISKRIVPGLLVDIQTTGPQKTNSSRIWDYFPSATYTIHALVVAIISNCLQILLRILGSNNLQLEKQSGEKSKNDRPGEDGALRSV